MSKKKEQIRNEILALRDSAIDGFDKYRSDFEKLEKGYFGTIDPKQYDSLKRRNKSAISPKIIRAKVRKVSTVIMKNYFSSDEMARLEFLDGNLTKVMQRILNEFARDNNLYMKVRPNVIDVLVYGTTASKVYWSKKINQIRIQKLNVDSFFIDPEATDSNEINYVAHRFFLTIGSLKAQYGKKIDYASYVGTNKVNSNRDRSRDIGDYQKVEVIETYRIQDDRWYVSTTVGDEFLREDVELKDGLPFIIGTIYPQFVSINETNVIEGYGDSFIAPMLPLQDEYAIRRNQQIDAIDLQLNPRYVTTRSSGLKEEELSGNIKKIVVNDLSQFKELPAPNINQSMYDVDKLDVEMQETSGVSKYSQGMNDGNLNQTATGMSILAQEGSDVIDDITRSLNESFFEPLIKRIVTLAYKYKKTDLLYGYDRENISKFKLNISAGVGTTSKEVRVNSIDNTINTFTGVIKMYAELGQSELAEKYVKLIDELAMEKAKILGIKNINQIIKGDSDVN